MGIFKALIAFNIIQNNVKWFPKLTTPFRKKHLLLQIE